MSQVFRVGGPFRPGISSYPEGSHYAWDPRLAPNAHHRIVVMASRPTPKELVAFHARGRFELALVVEGPAIALLWSGAGWPQWSETFYSWHSQRTQGVPSTEPLPVGGGVLLDVFLVDAATGLIVAIRRLAMPGYFGLALHTAIAEQASAPWDERAYNAQLAAFAREPCERIAARARARCTLGTGSPSRPS